MNIPKGLKYTKDHEWVALKDGKAYVGITAFAQLSLGDIVFVELPALNKRLKTGDAIGVVESVKTVADVYSPLSGTITEVNGKLTDSPELLNTEPYDNWIAVIEPDDPGEAASLMSEAEYEAFCLKEG